MLVFNDQGGGRMDITEDITQTLRAEDHGHPPLILEAYSVHENQQARVYVSDIAYQLTTHGGKPGQGYPCVLQLITDCKQLKGTNDLVRE